jgi:isopentenyl diphosphate isomerase/L-lactate dehydrogenase-like FMN-dependent dehydrogenase
LDTSPATIGNNSSAFLFLPHELSSEALPAIAHVVKKRVPLILDGGIRRGLKFCERKEKS